MLDVTRMRMLYEVARHGSLTRAAAALTYTTSALSQQISTLERETGAQLLERHARGVRLTEAGRALVQHTERILTELRAAESSLAAILRADGGRLRFGSFNTANATLMPQAVSAFMRRHPLVEVELIEADRDEAMAALTAHELDLALVYDFAAVPLAVPDGIQVEVLMSEPLYIMLPPGHRLAALDQIELTDLAGERWIQGVHRGSTLDVLPKACRAAGFEPNIVFRTDDQMTVRGLVGAGVGIALAPHLTLPATPPDLSVRPMTDTALTRTVMVATPQRQYRLPATTAMIEQLRTTATHLRHHTSR
ncbi:LysR family transcriptional regulator [Nonomuraea endophytica]|uniref:LysR family transcriptional regulator n=1 Tax=Nonomuraea endophytica TaxID=714136 RepID=UPI0037CB09B5